MPTTNNRSKEVLLHGYIETRMVFKKSKFCISFTLSIVALDSYTQKAIWWRYKWRYM